MKITPGTKFRLLLSAELRVRLHCEGWTGAERGGVEQMDGERVTVRFADGQPRHFQRGEFEAACVHDSRLGKEGWESEALGTAACPDRPVGLNARRVALRAQAGWKPTRVGRLRSRQTA